jgi:hypothetical protein
LFAKKIFKKIKIFVKKIAKKKNGNPPRRLFKILPGFLKKPEKPEKPDPNSITAYKAIVDFSVF